LAMTTIKREKLLSTAGKRGGSSKKHYWTDEERDIVRREYKGTNESARWIADYLSHFTGEKITLYAVKGQVQKMGLALNKSRSWTEKEEQILEDMINQYAPLTIAHRLKRSVNSVVLKSKRMRLSRRIRDGWYTKREICGILGVDHKKIQHWIDLGYLKGEAHFPGDTPQKNGFHPWHFKEKDVKDFIINYAYELQGRNVDIWQLVNILLWKEH
jgi:hypothetical protein